MSYDPNQKRGGAVNAGNWTRYENSDPDAVLTNRNAFGQTLVEILDHDGGPIHITTYPEGPGDRDGTVTLDSFDVFDGSFESDFLVPRGSTPEHIRQVAVTVFDVARVRATASRKGIIPSLDKALDAQIATLNQAIAKPLGLRAPQEWDYQFELHSASSRRADTLSSEQAHAPVDYAVVGLTGVDYGVKLPESAFGRVLVGEQGVDENDLAYKNRWQDEAWDQDAWPAITTFLENEYGATLQDDIRGSVTVEFHVPYRPEDGIDGSSIEEMGERATTSTAVERLRDEFPDSGGDGLEEGLAKALGYEFDPTSPADSDGMNEGRYRKLAPAAS